MAFTDNFIVQKQFNLNKYNLKKKRINNRPGKISKNEILIKFKVFKNLKIL